MELKRASTSLGSDYHSPKRIKNQKDVSCPICLNCVTDLTLLSTCTHVFCHDCIIKWITQKANCPLCKMTVGRMKHKLRAHWSEGMQFCEVPGVEFEAQDVIEEIEFRSLRKKQKPLDDERDIIVQVIRELNILRQSLTIPQEKRQFYTTQIKSLIHLCNACPSLSRRALVSNPLFRFVVYHSNADRTAIIKTSTDVTITPEYIARHYKTLELKLVPFVLRELKAASGRNVFDITSLVMLFLNCMRQMNKYRGKLQSTLNSMGIEHPLTVFNSIKGFVEANQSMKLYDSNSHFVNRITLGSSFQEDDVEVIGLQTPQLSAVTNPYFGVFGENVPSSSMQSAESQEILLDDSEDEDVQVYSQTSQSSSNSANPGDVMVID